LQRLARERIRDAKALLESRRWAAADYVAGYAVECGLKSSIIRYLMRTDQFPERRYSEQCWTHSLGQLLALADLKIALDTDCATDPDLASNWEIAKEWTESSRYERTPRTRSLALFKAITDKKHGVFSWITARW
jgi:HEPN domain-containing protein